MAKGNRYPLLLEERKVIERMLKTTMPATRIARGLNRPSTTVVKEIARNGGRTKYSAEKAQERADQLEFKKCERMARMSKERYAPEQSHKPMESDLETKIRNIEMQIEIMFDLIKELKEND